MSVSDVLLLHAHGIDVPKTERVRPNSLWGQLRWCPACDHWWPDCSPFWRVVPAGTTARAERPYVRRTDVHVCFVHAGRVSERTVEQFRFAFANRRKVCGVPGCLTVTPREVCYFHARAVAEASA